MFVKHENRIQRAPSALLILMILATAVMNLSAHSASGLMQFTSRGHVLGFSSTGMYAAAGSHALRVDFVGATTVQPQSDLSVNGEDKTAPMSRVSYADLWPGISLTYDAPDGMILRSTYTLRSGANPENIRLRYNAPLTVLSNGALKASFASGFMTESAPIAWQVINGMRVPVDVRYAISEGDDQTVAFAVGAYDPHYSLMIDPDLTWNTFLGGNGNDYSRSIALDTEGNVYITGNSSSAWGCDGTSCTVSPYTGDDDVFVAKVDGVTGELLWNTFLGGVAKDEGFGIAVDGNGNIYVSGNSQAEWGTPVQAFSGEQDGFAAKLDPSGTLIWNTFLGGAEIDRSWGVAVDESENVFVSGNSRAPWSCSPTDCTVRPYTGDYDAYAAMLDSTGALVWNTFLGGSGVDDGYGITFDVDGNIYVAGYSTAGWGDSPMRAYTGGEDNFAAKLGPAGALIWNTFLGGAGKDYGYGIVLDDSGNVYVAGSSTESWGSPVRGFSGGSADGFAAQLDPFGVLNWHTFLGGEGYDYGYGIAVDANGLVYVGGGSDAIWGSPLRDYVADMDGFAAKLSQEGALKALSFMGDVGTDKSYGIAVFGNDENVLISGYSSGDWGSSSRAFAVGNDAFAARADLTPPVVASITRDNPNPTAADTLTFTVTFSEPVTGVDLSDFFLTTTNNTSAAISDLVGVDDVYTVTITTGPGNGVARLDVVDDDTIENGFGKPLGGIGAGNGDFTRGEEYLIVKTAPVLLAPANGTILHYNRPAFDWSNFPGATLYQIQISKNETFTKLIKSITVKGATLSNYTPTFDLPSNIPAYWRVRARVGRVYTPWSVVFTLQTANPPSVPLQKSPAANALVLPTSPLFNWADSIVPAGTDFAYYQFQIATDKAFVNIVHDQQLWGLTNSQDGTAVLNTGTRYYWRVRSFNMAGDYSTWSPGRIVRIKYLAPVVISPGADENNPSPNLHTDRPTFMWNPVAGAASYTVEVSATNTFSTKLINVTTTATTYTHTADLAGNIMYYWRVKANGLCGPSPYSSPLKTFITGDPPSAPVLILPAANSLQQTTTPLLDWNDSTVNTDSPAFNKYEIQIATDNVFSAIVTNEYVTDIAVSQLVTPALANGATYYWRVRSWNVGADATPDNADDDFSGWSLARSFRVAYAAPTLTTPTDGATGVARKPTFTWDAIPGAVSYTLQVSTSPLFSNLVINKLVNAPKTTYIHTVNLLPNTLYYWRVRANGPYGPGPWQLPLPFSFTTGL